MNNRKIGAFILCLFIACNTYAQRPFRIPSRFFRTDIREAISRFLSLKPAPVSFEQDISRALYDNMLKSYQVARSVQYNLDTPYLCNILPSKKIIGALNTTTTFSETASAMYPNIPHITTPEQIANIFLANNNNLAPVEQQRMAGWLSLLAQKVPALKEETTNLVQPQNLSSWLAQQIPSETKTLFIGELHRKENIKQFIRQLLPQLRASHPDTPIFLFTEFLPSRFEWMPFHNPATHPYGTVFQTSLQENITVIGLEPQYVQDNFLFLEYKNRAGQKQKVSIWTSLEGMRLRNEHYTSILQEYRRTYPDALFIVYTGAAHVQYNSPFSLSKDLSPQETFVVSLYPAQRLGLTPAESQSLNLRPFYTSLTSEFDFATGGTFPQQVLYWQTKDSARAAGFDVQLKLPDPFR